MFAVISLQPWLPLQVFFVSGVMDVGSELDFLSITIGDGNCTNITYIVDNGRAANDTLASFRLSCITPPGVGSRNPVIVASSLGRSSTMTAINVQYAPPRIDRLDMTAPIFDASSAEAARGAAPRALRALLADSTTADANAIWSRALALMSTRALQGGAGGAPQASIVGSGSDSISTLGAIVRITGRYFGDLSCDASGPQVFTDLQPAVLLSRTDSEIVAVLPPGDGRNHRFRVRIRDQESEEKIYHYAPPSLFNIAPTHGPTTGNYSVTLSGLNFGVDPLQYVTVGGRLCPVISRVPHVNHSSVTCLLPPGQGAFLPVNVTVNGQISSDAVAFSFDPPAVNSVAPMGGPTSGRTKGSNVDDAGVFTKPGNRIVMVLKGVNLGRYGSVVFKPTLDSGPGARGALATGFDILPSTAVAALLARAGPGAGIDSVAGMSASDAEIELWETQALRAANITRAAGGTAGVSYAAGATMAPFRDVDRAWNETSIVFFLPPGEPARAAQVFRFARVRFILTACYGASLYHPAPHCLTCCSMPHHLFLPLRLRRLPARGRGGRRPARQQQRHVQL